MKNQRSVIKSQVKSILNKNNKFDQKVENLTDMIMNYVSPSYLIIKCDNCGEDVEMISTGEMCPNCFC